MSRFSQVDLSKLPAPDIIKPAAYEVLLADMKLEAIQAMPELAPFLALESEPVSKLLRVCAWFRFLDRLEFNDDARGCMLALATGPNLDGLAAFWGVERLIIQAGDDQVDPPIPEILEDDAALRARTQLSLEGHTSAGTIGAYIFHAISADGAVKDAAVSRPAPGEVEVAVLAHGGDGTPSAALLALVVDVLDETRPLCDLVTVKAASITLYSIEAVLTLMPGADSAQILAAAQAEVAEFIAVHHNLGHDITRAGLTAALFRPGVQNIDLIVPAVDLVIAPDEAAFCGAAPILTVGGFNV
ncbi:baseplate assembly protein [Halocynthiibacter namhaensis]|uniref:baseplate assembly protein n=1 Tax=Halocynthiibacter namhaensis TaxID=1290553 RepID=UPI0005799BF5|nr:baseplate J/gp47 family protein [Halocynthiibacter namhaensis]